MKILNVLGKVGAVVAGGAALFLAGKSGFGKDLNFGGETANDPSDQGDPIETTGVEASAPAEEAVVETTENADPGAEG